MSPQVRGSVRRDPRESRRLPIREVEELWDVPKFAKDLPPNPRPTSHAPEHVCLRDIRGRQIVVAVCTIVKFPKMTSSVRIGEVTKLRKPVEARDLWTGARHHRLTHALRVLQVNSQKPNGTEPPREGMFRLREGIRAEELLASVGAQSVSVASDLLQMLRDHKLVVTRSEGERYLCWVDKNVRGIGPNRELYTKQDLINDWILPEFEYIAQDSNGAGHHDEEEGETEVPNEDTPADLPPDEDGQTPPGQVGQRKLPPYLKKNRHVHLTNALRVLAGLVPSDCAPAEDGFYEFAIQGVPAEAVAKELDITTSQADGLLADLDRLNVYKSVNIGGGRYRRRLRAEVAEITEADIAHARVKKAPESSSVRGRLRFLYPAYLVLLEQVPEGLEPDAEGFVTFETLNVSFRQMIAERIPDLSKPQAERLINDFGLMGVLTTVPRAAEGRFVHVRRLKLGIKRFTEADLDKVRAAYRRGGVAINQGSTGDPYSVSSDMATLLDDALRRIDEQDDEIGTLKQEVQQRDEAIKRLEADKMRLETELANARTPVVPEDLLEKAEQLRSRLKKR